MIIWFSLSHVLFCLSNWGSVDELISRTLIKYKPAVCRIDLKNRRSYRSVDNWIKCQSVNHSNPLPLNLCRIPSRKSYRPNCLYVTSSEDNNYITSSPMFLPLRCHHGAKRHNTPISTWPPLTLKRTFRYSLTRFSKTSDFNCTWRRLTFFFCMSRALWLHT